MKAARTREQLDRDFVAALKTSTPIVTITTSDQFATLDRLVKLVKQTNGDTAMLAHDVIHGLRLALEGHKRSGEAQRSLGLEQDKTINPVAVLAAAETKLLDNTVLFMLNGHRHFADLGTRMLQAVANVRDEFKRDFRMLVILTHGMTLPRELEGDVAMFDEPLPTAAALRTVVLRQHENAKLAAPSADTVERAVSGLAGLSDFAAEQVTASSLEKAGINLDQVWARKRKMIENTPGLSVWTGDESFSNVGGYDNVKAFFAKLLAGPERPDGIVFIDEIEKDTAGMKGDNTGVAQKQHKALLTFMQDKKGTRGITLVGVPGAGKSTLAKAVGNEAGVPTIALNLGEVQASHVGQSEELMRNALKTIDAVCQGKALFIATCNDLAGLSPELRARFKNGTFFFDVPNTAERESIWRMYLAKYKRAAGEKRPHSDGWVGREIEACCDQAHALGLTLVEAAEYIVTQLDSAKESIEKRRTEADGAIISASYSGKYQKNKVDARGAGGERAIAVG